MFAHSSRHSLESSQYTISANDSLLTLTGVLWEKSRLSKTKSFPRLLKVSGFLEITPFSFWGKSRRFAITPSSSVKSPSFYNNLLPHLPRVPDSYAQILPRPSKAPAFATNPLSSLKISTFATIHNSSVKNPSFRNNSFLVCRKSQLLHQRVLVYRQPPLLKATNCPLPVESRSNCCPNGGTEQVTSELWGSTQPSRSIQRAEIRQSSR